MVTKNEKVWKKISDNIESYKNRLNQECFCVEIEKLRKIFKEEGLLE